MLERNKRLLEEQEKLEKGRYKGQTLVHWNDGVAMIIDFPKKALRKELFNHGPTKEELQKNVGKTVDIHIKSIVGEGTN